MSCTSSTVSAPAIRSCVASRWSAIMAACVTRWLPQKTVSRLAVMHASARFWYTFRRRRAQLLDQHLQPSFQPLIRQLAWHVFVLVVPLPHFTRLFSLLRFVGNA